MGPWRSFVLDASSLARPQLGTVGALARIVLRARRLGYRLRLRNASGELRALIALAGLEEALPVEAERQPEQREEPLRVEEERELDDPARR